MAQVTIYLDDGLAQMVRETSKARAISQSKWIAQAIQAALKDEWPQEVRELAGAWQDFPTIETIRQSIGHDVQREAL